MKSLGIVRKVDELGRIVIPKENRDKMGFEEGTPLEIFVDNDTVVLKKYTPGCYCCPETDNLVKVMGLRLCTSCVDKFYKARKKIADNI